MQPPQRFCVFAALIFTQNTAPAARAVSRALSGISKMQLRLTGKLQKELGLKPKDLCEPQSSSVGLGSWTANIFTEDRRKALVFINEKTLYAFMLFGVRKDNIQNIKKVFVNGLTQLLTMDGFSEQQIKKLMAGYDQVQFTKTNSKQILGNLNDITQLYQFSIHQGGGFKYCDINEIIHKLNRMPQRNIGWGYAIDAVREIAKQPRSA